MHTLQMYKIPLQRQNILSAHQVEQLFPSLEELILFHSGLCADLKERVGSTPNQDSIVVNNIADVLLHRVRVFILLVIGQVFDLCCMIFSLMEQQVRDSAMPALYSPPIKLKQTNSPKNGEEKMNASGCF